MTIPSDSVPTGTPVDEVAPPDEPRDLVAEAVADVAADRAARRRTRRLWGLLAAVTVVLGLLVALSFLVKLPYYLIEPGSVRPAEQRIEVQGARAYETEGRVLFTTVYLVQATPANWLRAQIDDAIEVVPEKSLYPKGDKVGERENRADMDLSKLVATREALDYLGVDATFTGSGARVGALSPESPSKGVLEPGDVITEVAGARVALPSDIGAALEGRAPGATVPVVFTRKDQPARTAEVVLGAAPEDPDRPVLGVQVTAVDPRVESAVEVEVDSGSVSGPSAGLAWTLAIIDRLTPSSLTQGKDVAVTGEILPDGKVGQIGGITQKVAAVKRAGIRTFLYPASTPKKEQAAMRRVAGDAVRLRPVETLDQAVAALDPELAASRG
ncbi:MAG: PDZ domain-containing protein [Actinomycetes bacterium]